MGNWPSKGEAQQVLDEWVGNENLKKHAYAVEAGMRAYAARFCANVEEWGVVGLLHDFDYERYPDLKDHPFKGAEYLRGKGYSDDLTDAILAHAEHTEVERDTQLKKTIYAVDELTGLIVAVALTRPSRKIVDVTVDAVMKKWKEKSFAAGVDRKMVEKGAEELGMPLREHVQVVLVAMQDISKKLGL